ncbi:MAG TPA: hypothetical protein H9733_03065, partial [Candidatus Anaerotignum merdipullorum]|nr:hypothetical protein [Candidatus Anaerotignum merdipullorum]
PFFSCQLNQAKSQNQNETKIEFFYSRDTAGKTNIPTDKSAKFFEIFIASSSFLYDRYHLPALLFVQGSPCQKHSEQRHSQPLWCCS